MAEIVEPLQPPRLLREPRKFAPLRSFSCGRKGQPSERTVNEWAKDLYRGQERDQMVVVLEDARHKLIAICSVKSQSLVAGQSVGKDGRRVHVIAVDRLYRGKRLGDGSRPADVLLEGTLQYVKLACDGHAPNVSALVSPENAPSHALFDRHGFQRWPYAGEGDFIYVRPSARRQAVAGLRTSISRLLASRPGRS